MTPPTASAWSRWDAKRSGSRPARSPRSWTASATSSRRPAGCCSPARGRVVVSGHGQVRPHRRQDRRDAREHRHARILPAPGGGQPRRPRHGHEGRCRARDLLLRRDRGTPDDPAALQAHGRAAHRDDRQSALDARARGGRPPRHQRARRSLPAQPRADGEHDGDARDGRCARGRAPQAPRLYRGGFRAFASGRRARSPPAAARLRRHAPRQRPADGASRYAADGGPARNVAQAPRPHRGRRRRTATSSASSPTATCAARSTATSTSTRARWPT